MTEQPDPMTTDALEKRIAYYDAPMGPDLQRKAEGMAEAGYAESPTHQRIRCACGYSGEPLVILRFDLVESDPYDGQLFVCPSCGDA